jgi:hypothetical protein
MLNQYFEPNFLQECRIIADAAIARKTSGLHTPIYPKLDSVFFGPRFSRVLTKCVLALQFALNDILCDEPRNP